MSLLDYKILHGLFSVVFYVYNEKWLILVALVLVYITRWYLRKRKLPPGPRGLPLLGYYLSLPENFLHQELLSLAKVYGQILSFYIGRRLIVVLSSVKVIEEFNNALDAENITAGKIGEEICDSSCYERHEWNKDMFFKALQKVSSKGETLEDTIMKQVHRVVEVLYRLNGEPCEPKALLEKVFRVILLEILVSKDFSYLDGEQGEFIRRVMEIRRKRNLPLTVTSVMRESSLPKPIEKKIQDKERKKVNTKQEARKRFLYKMVKEHRKVLDPDRPRDFVDLCLVAGRDTESIINSVVNLVSSGFMRSDSDMVAGAVRWGILYLSALPEIQLKMQDELDRVVGRKHCPTLETHKRLPFCRAVVAETFRLTTLRTTSVARRVDHDITISGFLVPRHTEVIINYYAVHMNGKVHPNPWTFNPARFLDEKGNFQTIPGCYQFGTGHRRCVGEQIATDEVFLMLTNIMHNFNVSLPSYKASDMPPKFEQLMGFHRELPSFKLVFKQRWDNHHYYNNEKSQHSYQERKRQSSMSHDKSRRNSNLPSKDGKQKSKSHMNGNGKTRSHSQS